MSTASTSAATQRRVITPGSGFELPSPRELWQSRDLMYLLMRRDIAVRYKQTFVGAAWAIAQPLALAGVFSLFLGRFAKIPSAGDLPYPVFALAGMVLWLYFANSLANIANSTLAGSALITKVYFPRVIIPISAAAQPLIDFLIAFSIVIPVALLYGVTPSPRAFLIPLLLLLTLTLVLGAGLWLSALNVRYRDVTFLVPFGTQIGLFITPIVYPFSLVPESVQGIYSINPMVGILETYRWLLFPGAPDPGWLLVSALVAAPFLLITGAWYFTRAEREFSDVI